MLRREECARGMGQKKNTNTNVAVLKVAQIKFKREEYAGGMEQKLNTNGVAAKDAPI